MSKENFFILSYLIILNVYSFDPKMVACNAIKLREQNCKSDLKKGSINNLLMDATSPINEVSGNDIAQIEEESLQHASMLEEHLKVLTLEITKSMQSIIIDNNRFLDDKDTPNIVINKYLKNKSLDEKSMDQFRAVSSLEKYMERNICDPNQLHHLVGKNLKDQYLNKHSAKKFSEMFIKIAKEQIRLQKRNPRLKKNLKKDNV